MEKLFSHHRRWHFHYIPFRNSKCHRRHPFIRLYIHLIKVWQSAKCHARITARIFFSPMRNSSYYRVIHFLRFRFCFVEAANQVKSSRVMNCTHNKLLVPIVCFQSHLGISRGKTDERLRRSEPNVSEIFGQLLLIATNGVPKPKPHSISFPEWTWTSYVRRVSVICLNSIDCHNWLPSDNGPRQRRCVCVRSALWWLAKYWNGMEMHTQSLAAVNSLFVISVHKD